MTSIALTSLHVRMHMLLVFVLLLLQREYNMQVMLCKVVFLFPKGEPFG